VQSAGTVRAVPFTRTSTLAWISLDGRRSATRWSPKKLLDPRHRVKRRPGLRARRSIRSRRIAEGGSLRGARPTEARIDLAALRANHALAAARAGGRRVIAVVKTDAYGHGAPAVARALEAAGCPAFAVMTLAEAAELRDAGVAAPLLALGGVHDAEEAEEAVARGVAVALHAPAQAVLVAEAAGRRGRRAEVQVEVDTGMRRMGVRAEEAPELLQAVQQEPRLHLAGVYTHFACAEDPDPGMSRAQLRAFAEVLAAARARGVRPGLVHVANSAALLAAPDPAAAGPETDAVRPGLLLYGVSPAPHLAAPLRPVMTLRTRVAALRRVAAGESVGYGATFRAARPGLVATLPLGYGDGVPWSAANRGSALLRGRRVPFAGRVSMDFVTLDAGSGPVEVGDEVVLFGEDAGGARLPVEEAAAAAGTLAYELLVRVGRRVPRIVVGD